MVPQSDLDVTQAAIAEFIFHADFVSFTGLESKKAVIRKQLKRFHPDKFDKTVLSFFGAGFERDQEKARVLAEAVTKVLNDLHKSVA